ncbi:MAG: type II toxin-antitoxin system RelE/ParE family toxin [Pseudomonadota bacterium]
MAYNVIFTPEAEEQVAQRYRYIAEHTGPLTAERYTSAIIGYCEDLSNFPQRGSRRDDIRPGLRTTNYKGNAVIAFAVDDAESVVAIIGVFYGGQDYARKLTPADPTQDRGTTE